MEKPSGEGVFFTPKHGQNNILTDNHGVECIILHRATVFELQNDDGIGLVS